MIVKQLVNNILYNAEKGMLTELLIDVANTNPKSTAYDLGEIKEQQEMADVIGEVSQNTVTLALKPKLDEAEKQKVQAQAVLKAEPTNTQAKQALEQANQTIIQYGKGGDVQMAIRAVTGVLQGLATKNTNGAIVSGLSPYANKLITEKIYNKPVTDLTEQEKETVSTLSQIAGGLVGGVVGGSSQSGIVSAEIGKRAVENNYIFYLADGTVIARDEINNGVFVEVSPNEVSNELIKRKKIRLEQLKAERKGVPLSLGELLELENNPVILTEEYAEKLINSKKEGQILDIRNNDQDRKVAEKRFGLNTYLPKNATLIYQNGILNTWSEAKETAIKMSKQFSRDAGVINNETKGWKGIPDLWEMRSKRPNVKDVLTFESYRKLNNLGNKALIITHSRGNDDFQDVARTNFYNEKFNNLSNLSVGSPISENKIKIASKKLGTNYLGQVNDPKDPVTWISILDGNEINISKPSTDEHLFDEYLKEAKVNKLIKNSQESQK